MSASGNLTPLDPCTLLREADAAWHALNTGATVRAVTDQNGERVEYSTANRAGLMNYIQQLAAMCPTYRPVALGMAGQTRPIRFVF